jgi:broad specificity phosphatase PhoE
VHASSEPKATETAKLVASRLGVDIRVRSGLEEHHRDDAQFFPDPQGFEGAIAKLFDNPDDLVYGSETAD